MAKVEAPREAHRERRERNPYQLTTFDWHRTTVGASRTRDANVLGVDGLRQAKVLAHLIPIEEVVAIDEVDLNQPATERPAVSKVDSR